MAVLEKSPLPWEGLCRLVCFFAIPTLGLPWGAGSRLWPLVGLGMAYPVALLDYFFFDCTRSYVCVVAARRNTGLGMH